MSSPGAEVEVSVQTPEEGEVAAFEGENVAEVDVELPVSQSLVTATLAQTVPRTVAVNTVYQFSVLATSNEIGGSYIVQITAGGVVLASKSGSIDASDPFPHTVTVSYYAPDEPAQVGQPIVAKLVSMASSVSGNHSVIQFDDAIMDEMQQIDDDGGGGGPPAYRVDLYFLNGFPGGGSTETLPRNDDFDEENRDATGNVVDDTQINAASDNVFGGNRVVADEEVRRVDLSIAAPPNLLAKWQMTHSVAGATTVWKWWENGNVNKPWPHWGLMTPGYSAPTSVPVIERFRVEGMAQSATPVNDLIQVEVLPLNNPPSSVVSDSVTATVTPSEAPLASPVNLVATAVSDTQIDLSWQPPAGAPAGTTYDIWRGTSPNFRLYLENTRFPQYVNRIQDGLAGTSYSDTRLQTGTTYYYCVSAVVDGVDTSPSNRATATPNNDQPSADLDVFEDENGDDVHDNSAAAEQLEATRPTYFQSSTEVEPKKLALVLRGISASQTVTFEFNPAQFTLYKDIARSQPIAANTPIQVSTFGLSGPGSVELYGDAAADGTLTGIISLRLSGVAGAFSAFLGGMIGAPEGLEDQEAWHNGVGDNEGGLDDGDGNQPLTDRDGWWDKPVKEGSSKRNKDGTFLLIGFAGHTQSMGFDTEKGRIWNVNPNSGIYQIGAKFKDQDRPVMLFPEDPGNQRAIRIGSPEGLQLCGDGVLGSENRFKYNRRVDSEPQPNRTGALEFLINAIKVYGKRDIGLFGYSHGGGSLELLIRALVNTANNDNDAELKALVVPQQPNQAPPVTFFWTADIDAVDVRFNGPSESDASGWPDGEDNYPLVEAGNVQGVIVGSTWHFNIYQNGDLTGNGDGRPLSGNDLTTDSAGRSWVAWRGQGNVGHFRQIKTDEQGSIWRNKYGAEGLDHTNKKGRGIAEDRDNQQWPHQGVQEELFKSFDDAFRALGGG